MTEENENVSKDLSVPKLIPERHRELEGLDPEEATPWWTTAYPPTRRASTTGWEE